MWIADGSKDVLAKGCELHDASTPRVAAFTISLTNYSPGAQSPPLRLKQGTRQVESRLALLDFADPTEATLLEKRQKR